MGFAGITERALCRAGEVKVLHPLTFRPWAGGRFFGLPGRRRCFGAHRALAHFQVTIAEANGHGAIQPDFDPHLRSAQAGTNIRASDPVDPAVELNRVAIAHFPGFDIAQRSCQRMALVERTVRIGSRGRHHRQSLVPPRDELGFQIGIGLRQSLGFRHPQPFTRRSCAV